MIQINLLPEVKQHFNRAQRAQRTAIFSSIVVAGASIGLLLLLFISVNFWQKTHIKNLGSDIARLSNQLSETPDLNRVLTVQQQLKSLTGLHQQKPLSKRLFSYLGQITPSSVTISKLGVDFSSNTFDITGSSVTLENVNKFVDTLKFTKYKLSSTDQEEKPAFSSVVLNAFGRDSKGATYNITLSFDPVIFDSKAAEVTLVVPQNFITTRSETERPQALFEEAEPGSTLEPTGDQ